MNEIMSMSGCDAERFSGFAAPDDQIEDAGRNARIVEDFGQDDRVQRRALRLA